jgi:ABC-type phosphate transport system auxiliary subunit
MGLVQQENNSQLPSWYETFLIVANTTKNFHLKKVLDKEKFKYTELAYSEILKTLKIVLPYKMTVKSLKDAIDTAVLVVKDHNNTSFTVKQSKLNRLFFGNKTEQNKKIIELVGKNLVEAAQSMKRFEGIDEAYFSDTKEAL